MATIFVSDSHLEAGKPHLTEAFLALLASPRAQVSELYLLGDIFDVWVGDDDHQALVTTIASALQALSRRGVRIFFMHGNRDFLLGKAFAERAGMELIKDPCVRTIGGVPTVLAHGDIYCTDDTAYQSFRTKSRNPQWQAKILGLPLFVRHLIAWHGRRKSKATHKTRQQAGMISDVNQDAIVAEFERFGVPRMIHGHTHRPDVHTVETKTGTCKRIVLSDWREDGEALLVADDGSFTRLRVDASGVRNYTSAVGP